MVTIQSAENALKNVYLGAVTELLNTKTNPLLAKIEHTEADVWGKEIRKAVSWGINGGIGAGDEDSPLPDAHGNNYLQFVTSLKNLYGQIEISDKAMRAGADERGAFADLLNAELQGLLNASKFNLGRMLYGDGTGKLSALTTYPADPAGKTFSVSCANGYVEGLAVDLYNGDNLVSSGCRIGYVDRDNNLVHFVNPPSGGSDVYVQGSKDKELTGLGAIFSDSATLYGVSRAEHKFLNPYKKAVNGQIDEIMMQEAIDRLENSAGSTVDFITCAADVKYAYQEYMANYKRNVDIMELSGGYKTLSYNGIPLVYDRFIEDGSMYLLNTKAFRLHQLCDWRFLETENGKILRQTQGKPTYTATLVKYCDLICDRPNGQAKLTGIVR
jgi:hypothetical protein